MERNKQSASPERLASAWLGAAPERSAAPCSQVPPLDMIANASLAQVTANLSPAALGNAYFDWLAHLQLAPSEQAGLLQKAWKNLWRWSLYAAATSIPGAAGITRCVEPLPQDRRFADPAWDRWPFNLIAQGFLLNQQWWHGATTGIPGVSRHHEDVVTFSARQVLDMLAPSNFISTNPVIQQDALHSNGLSLVRGAQLAMADVLQAVTGHAADEAFKVGENMAVTPGSNGTSRGRKARGGRPGKPGWPPVPANKSGRRPCTRIIGKRRACMYCNPEVRNDTIFDLHQYLCLSPN